MTKQAPKTTHPLWLLIGVLAVAGAGWIVFDAASDKGVAFHNKILLCLAFLIYIVALWKTQQNLPRRLKSWAEWKKPKALWSVLLVPFGALGFIGGIVQLVSPRAATESKGGLIEATTNQTLATTTSVEDALENKGIIPDETSTMIERNINGIWGQTDCANTYRFTLDAPGSHSRVLKLDSVKSLDGLKPYEGEFVFKTAADKFGGEDGFERSTMSTQEVKGFHPGFVVEFTLEKAGSSETLLWSNKSDEQADPTLIRCPEPEAKK